MEKRKLMEYLKALCEVEDSIYACDKAIEELEYEMRTYDDR